MSKVRYWRDLATLSEPELQPIWLLFLSGVIFLPYTTLGAIPVAIGLFWLLRMNASEICATRLNWLLGLLSVSIIAISSFSLNYLESLASAGNIIPFLLFFASYQYLFRHPDTLRKLAWVIILSSIPIVIIGFGQLWGGWNIDWKIGTIQIFDVHRYGMPRGRMASIFYHANALANYLQIVFTLCLGLCLDIQSRSNRKWQILTPEFLFLSCYLIITLLALILTSARTGWIVTILSILAMVIYQKWYFMLGLTSIAISIIIGAAYAPDPAKSRLRQIVPSYFWARINDEMYPNRPTADTRESIFEFAGQLISKRPWTGWGLQTFGDLYRSNTGIYINHPHNLLLNLSYGLGIPVTILIMMAMGYIFYITISGFIYLPPQWRSERTIVFTYLVATIGFILMNMTDITAFVLPLNFLFWSMLIALYGIGKISLEEYHRVSKP